MSGQGRKHERKYPRKGGSHREEKLNERERERAKEVPNADL